MANKMKVCEYLNKLFTRKKFNKIEIDESNDWNYWSALGVDILDDINVFRDLYLLKEFIPNSGLTITATARALYYKEHLEDNPNYYIKDHQGFTTVFNKVTELGFTSVGECIGYGYTSALGAVKAWVNSPAHNKILMKDYIYIGVGVVEHNGRNIIILLVSK